MRPEPRGTYSRKNPLDLTGRRFDRLVVLGKVESTPSGAKWLCECDCGERVTKITTQLRRQSKRAAGCRRCEADVRSRAVVRHGGRKQNTAGTESLYKIWKTMRRRCADLSNPHYGGKGVRVCDEWSDYDSFRRWALEAGYVDVPAKSRGDRMSIERIDPSKGYSPDNCEWITVRENSRRMAQAQARRAV